MEPQDRFARSAYLSFLVWGICASLGTTVTSMLDAALVGNLIGSEGLAVTGFANPVFLVYALLGTTLSVGANVMIGRALGASRTEDADRVFNAQLFAAIALGVVLLLSALLFRRSIYRILGVPTVLLPMFADYIIPVFFAAPIMICRTVLSLSVSTDGEPRLNAISSAVVILVTALLELLFMGVLGLGILGASLAILISEACGVGVLLLHFRRPNAILHLRLRRPRAFILWRFAVGGFGIGSAYVFEAMVLLLFNQLLSADPVHGVANVAVFGVFYTVIALPLELFDGAGDAFAPVISVLTGEQDVQGIMQVLTLALRIVLLLAAGLLLLFIPFAAPILRLFGIDSAVAEAAIPAFRVISCSIAFSCIGVVVTAFWQTIGRARLASLMSLLRNLVAFVVLGAALIPGMGLMGVALTYLLAEGCCLLLTLAVLILTPSRRYIAATYGPTGRLFRRYYVISTDSMEAISRDLEALCDDWQTDPERRFFLNFIVEELLLNIIKFGLAGEHGARYIDLRISESAGEYILNICDNVGSYNPFSSDGDDIDTAVLTAIRRKSRHCFYRRKLIFNHMFIVL